MADNPWDAEGDASGASPAIAAIATATTGTRTPTSHPYDSGTEERSAPACSGGHGAAGTALAPAPRTAGTRTRSSSSTFSSVTCHRGRVPRQPPSPIFGYDEPRDGHAALGRDPADGEEAHWDPRAARGGGRSGWRDRQHGHPSPGAPTAPVGPPYRGPRPGVWHSPRAAGSWGPLKDVDLVPLDTVQVIVQRQQHLWSEGSGRAVSRGSRGSGRPCRWQPAPTRKEPNMAMEERKCQMSWSSKKSSRMQSRLCSRDSAGVFCWGHGQPSPRQPWPPRLPQRATPGHPPAHLPCAEPLEEEEEGEAPDHRGTDDAEQRDELDALAAAELRDRPGSLCRQELAGVPVPALPCPPRRARSAHMAGPGAGGLGSHLHDDVEGKVEEEVADADDQQVGSEVIGTDNEAVGSAGEAGTGSGVSTAWGSPRPPCPCAPLSPRPARRSGSAWGHRGCRSDRGHVPCSAHSCHELAVLSPAEGTAAGGGLGPQEWGGGGSREGERRAGRSGAGSGLCPAPHLQRPVDDVSHDQEHHSILQRARGAVRGGRGQRCQAGSPQSRGPRCREPRCQHSPRTWARCTAGRSPCTARAGSCAGCPSLRGEERSCRGGPPCHPTPTLLTAVPPSHPASSAPCSRAGCSAAGWPRCG